MVTKSVSRTWMHIFTRRSSKESISQALAWQTTSRSAGLVKSDRSQKVCGSGAKPIEVKKPSPYFTIPFASRFFFLSSSVILTPPPLSSCTPSRSYTLPHSCAQGLPSRCAGIGEIDESRIALPHGRRNRVPSRPNFFELLRIAAAGHQLLDRRNVQTLAVLA